MFLLAWLKAHPEVVTQFEVADDDTLVVQIWNPDKTKILFQTTLNRNQQLKLISRLEGFFL